jgi:ribonuclease R
MSAKRPAPPIDKAKVFQLLADNPGATKRDLVRLMGLKGSDRIELKRTLKELEGEGLIAGTRRSGFAPPDRLPEVTVLEIAGPDADGELTARPLRWESETDPPPIYLHTDDNGALAAGDKLLARLTKRGEGYEARIIRALGKAPAKVLAVVRIQDGSARAVQVDRKSGTEFSLDARELNEAADNDLVLVEPSLRRAGGLIRAKIVERLGSLDAPRSVSLIAIHAHGIPDAFPADAADEAAAAGPVADGAGRTDLRGLPLVTIDPEDARDFDDAVWAGPDEGGGFSVVVAIADVAHYVTPGSALDREAFKRGNSVYFPDRVVPMLPEQLSNHLCSLKPDQDRPCLAVRMHFDAAGRMKAHTFLRATMRSAARLTYAQAQKAFDGAPVDIPAAARPTLAALWAAYRALAAARDTRGPLDLNVPERRVEIGDDGKVTSIRFKDRLESMRLIEEMMVMANVAAAETLVKHRQPLIFRIHETPSQEKLHAFADYLHTLGIAFAKGQVVTPAVFNRILERAKDGPQATALNDMVLRTQAQAVYDPVNIGHFGLALDNYAHFTSPIRRYADLIVHRALIKILKAGDDGLTECEAGRLAVIAEHISMTERRAMEAERDSTERYVAAFMADRVGAHFEARIVAAVKFGLFVRLSETGAEGLLPARVLGTEYFRFDDRSQALVGERTGTTYAMGDTIAVRLAEAAPVTGALRFDLAEAEAPRKRPHTQVHPRSKRRR